MTVDRAWLVLGASVLAACSSPAAEDGAAARALVEACAGRARQIIRPMSRGDAIECADAFRAAHDPHFRAGRDSVRVHDDGEAWIVSYHLRSSDAVGGGAIILVSKHATLTVGSLAFQ